jgi:hypothetical protein
MATAINDGYPEIVLPVEFIGNRFGAMHESRVSQLFSHQTPQWKQRLFQAEQKQGNANQNIEQASQYFLQIRYRFPDDQKLKAENNGRYRQHIQHGLQEKVLYFGDQFHQINIPYTSTKIIGNSEANAIKPKPSIIGLRPLMDDASPMPSAVTSGTVMVDDVTPPES